MGEEVERLEHHAGVPSHEVLVDPLVGEVVAEELDRAAVDRLEEVAAAQQRRLARARRADQADDLVGSQLEADSSQDLEIAEALVDVVDSQDDLRGAGRHWAPASRRPRSLAMIRSV